MGIKIAVLEGASQKNWKAKTNGEHEDIQSLLLFRSRVFLWDHVWKVGQYRKFVKVGMGLLASGECCDLYHTWDLLT